MKYSGASRTVQVETKQNGSGVEIAVRDEGIGIDPREQSRIFEKFVRGGSAAKSNAGGTGIGLSTARHIARAHGGEITVSSRPGKGSTFVLSLPAQRNS